MPRGVHHHHHHHRHDREGSCHKRCNSELACRATQVSSYQAKQQRLLCNKAVRLGESSHPPQLQNPALSTAWDSSAQGSRRCLSESWNQLPVKEFGGPTDQKHTKSLLGQICFVAIEISFRWTSVAQIKEDGGLRECWNYTCHVCVWWQKSRRPGFSFENIFWDMFVRWMERSSSRGSQWLIVTHAFGWIETSGMFLWVSNREKQEWASQCVHTLLSALHWVINSPTLWT